MDVILIYMLIDEKPGTNLILKGESFKYLVKSRRQCVGDVIKFRSKDDIEFLYECEVTSIQNRSIELEVVSSKKEIIGPAKALHIAWCIIDTKSIEKILPSLNEIGVSRISFIGCERSQNNFKLDMNRFKRILESSMQQSGRSTYIEFDTYKNVQDFIEVHPKTKVFDFTETTLDDYEEVSTVLIGCEGGFSQSEQVFLQTQDVFRLKTSMVLRSESAVMAVASKVLL